MTQNAFAAARFREQQDCGRNSELEVHTQAPVQAPVLSRYFGGSLVDNFAFQPRTRAYDRPSENSFASSDNISRTPYPAANPHSTLRSEHQNVWTRGQATATSPTPNFWQSPVARKPTLHRPPSTLQQFRQPSDHRRLPQNIYQRQSESSSHRLETPYVGLENQYFNAQPQPQPQFTVPTPLLKVSSHTPDIETNDLLHGHQQHNDWSSPALPISSPSIRLSMRPNVLPQNATNDHLPYARDIFNADTPSVPLVHSLQTASTEVTTPGNSSMTAPTVQGIRLIPTSTLPDRLRQVFSFGLFNAIQSKCFEHVFNTNDNVVVSAPTGGGKTAILELAICRLVQTQQINNFKIIYQAPTKSLCSERARDWQSKFKVLGLECAELTGDTDAGDLKMVASASIIVTTPEKWDSITRKWSDHEKLLRMVRLLLIDEVHIVGDTRGATLEAVVSRMRTIGASVRMIALSATVPNSHDIATWLGRGPINFSEPAHREVFGEEFRPVPLQKHVHGYNHNGNYYHFESKLDDQLPALIAKYTCKKPLMVFCFSRKSCEATAERLSEWWHSSRPQERAWAGPRKEIPVADKSLHKIVGHGVAFHHAGLDTADRRAIEAAYISGNLGVIVCTSTLAVGVNLPCHMVIIKGTMGYAAGTLREYPDLEVMQMLGRAGRPQFDHDAVAIIMTPKQNVDRYLSMESGQQTLESTLHLNLIEHLNSEVTLGTVHSLQSAKMWLSSTFLAIRLKQNPTHYNLDCDRIMLDAGMQLEGVCERDMKQLQDENLVTEGSHISATEYGNIMSKLMISFNTMRLVLDIPFASKMGAILTTVSEAQEFKEIRMKPIERNIFRELNNSNCLKYPIKETVLTQAHKVMLLIQAHLGDIAISFGKGYSKQLCMRETSLVLEHAGRLVRCVTECKAHASDAVTMLAASELSRSMKAGVWEHSPHQLRQIPFIGPVLTRKFIANNIRTIEQLNAVDTTTIERIASRNPPFGKKVLDAASRFPKLSLKVGIIQKILKPSEVPRLQMQASLAVETHTQPSFKKGTHGLIFVATVSSGRIAHIWSSSIAKILKSGPTVVAFTVELTAHDDIVTCHFSCDDVVGTSKSTDVRPDIPPSAFTSITPRLDLPRYQTPAAQAVEENIEDEYADMDMIQALDSISSETVQNSVGHETDREPRAESYDFFDIDEADFEAAETVNKDTSLSNAKSNESFQPIQMANGKWECNHDCRNGKLLKANKPCKHRCCSEGLEKPIKPKKRRAKAEIQNKDSKKLKTKNENGARLNSEISEHQMKLSFTGNRHSPGTVETLDLVEDPSTIEYENLTPHEYHELHALHTKVQTGNAVNLSTKTKPLFPNKSGRKPGLPLSSKGNLDIRQMVKDPFEDDDDDDATLPTIAALLDAQEPKGIKALKDVKGTDDFDISDEEFDSVMVAIADTQMYHESVQQVQESPFDELVVLPAGSPEIKTFDKLSNEFLFDVDEFSIKDVDDQALHAVSSTDENASLDYLNTSRSKVVITNESSTSQVPLWTKDFDSQLVDYLGTYCDFEPDVVS